MSGARPKEAPTIEASAFLEKPLAAAPLLAAVERVLGQRKENTGVIRCRRRAPLARRRRQHPRAQARASRTLAPDLSHAPAVREEEQRKRQMARVSQALSHIVNNALQGLMSYAQCPARSDTDDAELQRAAFAGALHCAAVLRRFAIATRSDPPEIPEVLAVEPDWIAAEWRRRCAAPVEFRISGLDQLRTARVPLELLLFAGDELISNAIEALEQGPGCVSIQITQRWFARAALKTALPVCNRRTGRWCCVDVTDNGRGMAPSVLGQIWSPFYSTKFAGRGLGLAEVLSRVSGVGGMVDATSTAGVGTTVRLLFRAT
jgi:signal transduction histidine kinase